MLEETSSTAETLNTEENATTEEAVNTEVETPTETESEVEAEKETRENERIRSLVEEKNTYQKMVELLTKQGNQNTQQTPNRVIEEADPEIDPDVKKVLDRKLNKKDQEYSQVISAMGEKMDDLESRDTVPNYKTNKNVIETYKDDYVRRTGRWISRYQAYAYLLADGTIKAPKESTVVVNRAKTKVVTETKTNSGGRSAGAKEFGKMNLAEKEDYLKDKKF